MLYMYGRLNFNFFTTCLCLKKKNICLFYNIRERKKINILENNKKASTGFEPATPSLRVKCSTTELTRHAKTATIIVSNKKEMIGKLFNQILDLLTNPAQCRTFMILIFLAEIVLNGAIVKFIPYTEIDWKAYMQEVEGYLNGSTNYL